MYNILLYYDFNVTPLDRSYGAIKNSLKLQNLKEMSLKNEHAINHCKQEWKINNPEFSEEDKRFIDYYVCELILDGHTVRIRFCEILNTSLLINSNINNTIANLLTRHFIYFNDTTSKNSSSYFMRRDEMIANMESRHFYDLTPLTVKSITRPFNYQLNNINWMIKTEQNMLPLKITKNRLVFFPDDRIYDLDRKSFIVQDDISPVVVRGGIIADEAGKGKTFQVLALCAERNIPTLVLVPDHLKNHWNSEIIKHYDIPLNIVIVKFSDLTPNLLKGYERLIVDEIHLLYCDDRFSKLYDDLLKSGCKYKWGMTGTPFSSPQSIFKIFQYLIEQNVFYSDIERFIHYEVLFREMFRRNIGSNVQDEIALPPLHIHNHFLDFNDSEKAIYFAEQSARGNADEMSLRKYCCDVLMKFNSEKVITRDNLRDIHLQDFEDKMNIEQAKLDDLEKKLKEIIDSKDQEVIRQNKTLYENKIRDQKSSVRNRTVSFNLLKAHFQEEKVCIICTLDIEGTYCLVKNCSHFFCESCFKGWMNTHNTCPGCRGDPDHFLLGNNTDTSPHSTKIMKLLSIIKSATRQFIVFTQFDSIISKVSDILNLEGIRTKEFSEENVNSFRNKEFQVMILSSKNNACGLDLSFVSDIVIFEPICGNYVKDIEKQIIARVYRINQTRESNIHRLIINDTIESQIYSNLI